MQLSFDGFTLLLIPTDVLMLAMQTGSHRLLLLPSALLSREVWVFEKLVSGAEVGMLHRLGDGSC